MHIYNAWLPPPVAELTCKEKDSFRNVLTSVKASFDPHDEDSVYSTLKFISVVELFIKAKSDLDSEDVAELVLFGLQVFVSSSGKLHAQVRWGNVLVKFLNKYRSNLSLTIDWRPLYDTLVNTHFTRSTGPEGWRLRQRHFETITALARSCRRFFPPGSASDIWAEFGVFLDNSWHDAALEGAGFIRLFLPTNPANQEFYTNDWIKKALGIWESIPNCQFWNNQWAAITARVIKNYSFIDWESFLPDLFSKYLNMFEVPIANGSGTYPFAAEIPRNMKFLFSNKTATPSKAIAKSVVYLIKPGNSVLLHLEKLVNFLEQYYHPSNGGRWTYSLERFLFYLVLTIRKRLQFEQVVGVDYSMQAGLGSLERKSFVKITLKMIDRGQYSKNDHLSETVATAISILSYVDPVLVLPFVASRFHLALETMTATHQLKASLMSVAYAVRPILFSSVSNDANVVDLGEYSSSVHSLPMISLSNALLGIDANDPPKTLAAMHLIGSIFSNILVLNDDMDKLSISIMINFSEWLDEFLDRLLALLQHLEPNNTLNEGSFSLATSGTFLVEDGSYYHCMIEILLGKLSKPLYKQVLERISKFVRTNILPGAVAEVGLLCCACVYTSPEDAVGLIVEPILDSIIASLRGTPGTGFGERALAYKNATTVKPSISPALEMSIDYQLKMLSVTISFSDPSLLKYRDKFKEAIQLAFNCSSWKVNSGGDHLLRSLLGSLILYYPLDQYKCKLKHPDADLLEKWISAKDYMNEDSCMIPKWHIPTDEEVQFANELLDLHLGLALDDLSVIFKNKIHSDSGNEKEHLKVTLLRISSSMQGVLSCLPDFRPSTLNGNADESAHGSCFIAGAFGVEVGSSILREKAATVMHSACKFLLEEKSDDSILLILLIRILDTLVNYGSLEYEEWSSHRQSWKLQSAAIVESPSNFILSSHQSGKKRPSWAIIDKAYMHNIWRSSQSSYHLYRTNGNFLPSEYAHFLLDDLLCLSLHSYETVRALAGKALVKLIKRWPSLISKCVHSLAGNLLNASSPECVVLGSCSVLSSQTVLKHLSTDPDSFSSFVIGILSSSHHESLKCQKAINELFVKYNIHFSGVSPRIFKMPGDNNVGQSFSNLISKIESLSYDCTGLHWRYNLMANRVLLLLAMASRSNSQITSKILPEVTGHFLKNLRSQLPQTRILAISALNTLLKESSYKLGNSTPSSAPKGSTVGTTGFVENVLANIFKEQGFFSETLGSLSHVHIISDQENASSRGANSDTSLQSLADKSITRFYFDFLASWPRTWSWISTLGNNTFYPNFARIFKRLLQECGMPVLSSLRSALEEFANAEERSKQCVAAEALAGVLHADVDGLLEAWDSWISDLVRDVILSQSVDSVPEWAACIRYIVTGKGKIGTRVPLLRQRLLDSLCAPLPASVTTSVVAKRYTFLSAALIEISPPKMPKAEVEFHSKLLKELLDNMVHSSAQVRKAVGVTLCVVCSNLRLHSSCSASGSTESDWSRFLTERASEMTVNIQRFTLSDYESTASRTSQNGGLDGDTEDDVKWMETLFHFFISTIKSGRCSYMLDVIGCLLHPVISLQETSKKDLSSLAKSAFEMLKWCFFSRPHLQIVVRIILNSFDDPNWRVRSTTLSYLRTFMYRHNFILSRAEEQEIWSAVQKLLRDNQVEVREHATSVLSGLIRSGDDDIAKEFRERASSQAIKLLKTKNHKGLKSHRVADTHGAVLALAASVLSVPYDMPTWLPEHVTLLARFGGEPQPIKSTVTKAVAEFRRTHADTWNIQKDSFTEEQLEVLADTSSSSSYFA